LFISISKENMNFKDMSLEEIISKIKSGETTNKEVFDYFMARTKKYDDKIKSYNFLNEN